MSSNQAGIIVADYTILDSVLLCKKSRNMLIPIYLTAHDSPQLTYSRLNTPLAKCHLLTSLRPYKQSRQAALVAKAA